ncbi:cytochrome c [Paraburkholderia sp. JPY465]|uniref:c-type cytochrome n=1 Tax=Paraburkholderia sp. JPY465 TaxID=3042285 RepID=UPI003D1E7265
MHLFKHLAVALAVASASVCADAQTPPAAPAAFSSCIACHGTAPNDNRIGPSLSGVFHRPAGSVAGFRYSRAMKHSGIEWNEQTLDDFLRNPQRVVAGNHMPFSGITDDVERKQVVRYLQTLR